jgi:hypothetical protein
VPAEICITPVRNNKEETEMKRFKAVTTICFTALMSAVLIPSASGDDWNRKTKITFSGSGGDTRRAPDRLGRIARRDLCIQDPGFAVRPSHRPDL